MTGAGGGVAGAGGGSGRSSRGEKPRRPKSETAAGARGVGAAGVGASSAPLAKLAVVVSDVSDPEAICGPMVAAVFGTTFVFATGTPISVGTKPTTTRTNSVDAASKPAAGDQRHATRSAKSLATVFIQPPGPMIAEEWGVVIRPRTRPRPRPPAGWRRPGGPGSREAS